MVVSNGKDKDDLVGDNEYMLNNKLINRDVMLEVLYEQHYLEIKKMTEAINDAIKLANELKDKNPDISWTIEETSGHFDSYGEPISTVIKRG